MPRGGHFLTHSQSRRRRLTVWMSQRAEYADRSTPSGAFRPDQLGFPTARVIAKVLAQPAPLTWLFTGDTLASLESGAAMGGTLISHLMGILRSRGGRHQDSVVSTVQPGCRLANLLEAREARVDRFRPDCVVINCHPLEIEETHQHYDELEWTVRTLTEGNRAQGALTVLNLPIRSAADSFATSVERLIRLEALRGSAIESGALVIDHWTDWEANASAEWYLPCGRLPSQKGLSRMARLCAAGLGLDVGDPPETAVLEVSAAKVSAPAVAGHLPA